MGMVDFVIILIVAAMAVVVCVYLLRQKKAGNGCCGNCSGCSQGCQTHIKKKVSDKSPK